MNKKITITVLIIIGVTITGFYLKSEYTKSNQDSTNVSTPEVYNEPQTEEDTVTPAPVSTSTPQPSTGKQNESTTNKWQIRFTSQDAISIARQAGALEGVPDNSLPTPEFRAASSTTYGMAWFFRTPSFAKVNADDCPGTQHGSAMKTAKYDVEVNAHSGEIFLQKLCGLAIVDF